MSIKLNPSQEENGARNMLAEASLIIHNDALRELTTRDTFTITRIIAWLKNRLERLEIDSADFANVKLNAWNKTNGLGLQSVSMEVWRPDGNGKVKPVLLPTEWKHPTVGIFANGMVTGDAKMGETRFPVGDADHAELITMFSDGLMMEEAPAEPTDFERHIPPHQADDIILVKGPNAVRVYCETKDPTPKQIRNVVHSGVYGCNFQKVIMVTPAK